MKLCGRRCRQRHESIRVSLGFKCGCVWAGVHRERVQGWGVGYIWRYKLNQNLCYERYDLVPGAPATATSGVSFDTSYLPAYSLILTEQRYRLWVTIANAGSLCIEILVVNGFVTLRLSLGKSQH